MSKRNPHCGKNTRKTAIKYMDRPIKMDAFFAGRDKFYKLINRGINNERPA